MDDEKVEYRIDQLLKQIDLVINDTSGLTIEEFSKSDLLVRATCFSIVQVGEQMNNLSKHLSDKYPDIPWSSAIKMRNLVVHVYNRVNPKQIFYTAINDLPPLKEAFIRIKIDLKKKVS